MSKCYLLLILITFSLSHINQDDGLTHFCGVDDLPPPIKISSNENTSSSPNADVPYTPYRIYYDYKHLESQLKDYGQEYITGVKNILENAKSMFEKIMLFKQRQNILKISENACYGLQQSAIVSNPGVPADMIIIPRIDPSLGTGTLASAGPCYYYDYPFNGRINISTNLPFTEKNSSQYLLALFMHEMTHIFVFNSSLFSAFRDPQGKQYPSVTIQRTVNGVKRTLLTTPKVVAAAKKHFGCDNIEGLGLEDYGGSGTAGNHWEARVMLGDYMIGVLFEETFLSDITMALFEDSGWYKMNYYTGGLFKFGKGEGCPFVHGKCIINKQSTSPKYFGTVDGEEMCLQGRITKGVCMIDKNKIIPKEYQYFDDPTQGGFDIADYCPVAKSYSTGDQRSAYNCKTGILRYAHFGEVLSSNSNCFLSTLTIKGESTMTKKTAICYPYQCNHEKKITIITIKDKTIDCPTEGGLQTFEGFEGSFECPKFNQICIATEPCTDIAECVNKKSMLVQETTIGSNEIKLSIVIIALLIAIVI